MMISDTPNGQYLLALSKDELSALNNCLNEVCNGINLFEFETRVGASREKVREMLKTIDARLARA
jgi:hypothetical protein